MTTQATTTAAPFAAVELAPPTRFIVRCGREEGFYVRRYTHATGGRSWTNERKEAMPFALRAAAEVVAEACRGIVIAD